MCNAYASLMEHLETDGVKFQSHAESQSVMAVFDSDQGSYSLLGSVDEEDNLLQFFAIAPIRVPVGSRPGVGEAIVRANWGLKVGKFEMDHDSGRLHFQVAHVFSDGGFSHELVHRLVHTALAMLDRYLPAIMSVIYGNDEPKEAVCRVEALA